MAYPRTVFITGANRGIGFELVQQLLRNATPPELIFATYRKKEDSKDLFDLAEKNKSVKPFQLEVRDHASFDNVVKDVTSVVGNKGINLLINNAGILEPNQGLMELTHQQMINAHEVNVISPLFLARAFLPLLRAAAQSVPGPELSWSRSTIINITSILGSVEFNTEAFPAMYAYKMSKGAVNMFSKSLSVDLKADKILVCAVHPGWVQTDMGGKEAPLTVQESVSSILFTLKNLNAEFNGKFISYDGKILPY